LNPASLSIVYFLLYPTLYFFDGKALFDHRKCTSSGVYRYQSPMHHNGFRASGGVEKLHGSRKSLAKNTRSDELHLDPSS
jgi:hypothetical protein